MTTSYPITSKPFVAKHIDGPVLVCADGQMHWLSLFERIQYALKFVTAFDLEHKFKSNHK